MIDHQQNGYVANYRDAADLAKGIHYVLDEANRQTLSSNCLQKVARNYSQQSVAKRYIELYESLKNKTTTKTTKTTFNNKNR
jgi:glycosyltransferase involved in cell wall biosynthesis